VVSEQGRRQRSRGIAVLVAAMVVATSSSLVVGAQPASLDATKYLDVSKADCGFQAAIDAAANVGGGVVRLPKGTFTLRRGLVLRSGVTLSGAGLDKTILVHARRTLRLDVSADSPSGNQVFLRNIPPDLRAGSAVVSCRRYPPSWYGSPRPAWVRSVDRRTGAVILEAPYGLNQMKLGQGYVTFGDSAALDKDVHRGDTEIHLKDAGLLRPGDELALGEPPNESLLAHVFVREVRGNVVLLEEPARIDFPAWPLAEKIGNKKVAALVWALFPLVHAANVEDCGVRDLTIRGHGLDGVRPMQTRYTLAGIHVFNGVRVTIERVAVRDWPSDGISLQTGKECRVANSQVIGCLGNGLHPGTGLKGSVYEGNMVRENGAGLYFCWHNQRHVVRNNEFVRNRGGGITGLGNPGDRENVIEGNRIAENGGPGIEINGGKRSGNVIRNNVIENNSQAKPGKHPGIALYAATEDARAYQILGNTIRDTQPSPTQFIGIEERHGTYRDKPTSADENVIEGNTFGGHKEADVVLVGPATRCEDKGKIIARRVSAGKE